MSTTGIDYLDATWNPTHGCLPGLACWERCWARTMARRLQAAKVSGYEHGFAPTFDVRRLAEPLHWKRPRRVGVSFMGDLFADGITDEQIAAVFGVMAACPQHTFCILTKRAERMARWFDFAQRPRGTTVPVYLKAVADGEIEGFPRDVPSHLDKTPWPLPNVWVGISASTQAELDARAPHLLRCPAAVRFVSLEPLIAPVSLQKECLAYEFGRYPFPTLESEWRTTLADALDLVIVGGESGPGARPMDVAWVRSLRDECVEARTCFYYKQTSGVRPEKRPLLDGRQWLELPGGVR